MIKFYSNTINDVGSNMSAWRQQLQRYCRFSRYIENIYQNTIYNPCGNSINPPDPLGVVATGGTTVTRTKIQFYTPQANAKRYLVAQVVSGFQVELQ